MPKFSTTGDRIRRQRILLRRGSATLARACGVISMIVGGLVVLGWALDFPLLKSALAGAVEMKANTAVSLILGGGAIMLFTADQRSAEGPGLWRLGQVLGAAVVVIGLATGAEDLFGWDLGIVEALFWDYAVGYAKVKGRMSPYSAAACAGIGIALVCIPIRRLRPVTNGCAGAAAMVGLISLMGYSWGASELMTDEWATPVAVHTAVALVLLSLGTLIVAHPFPKGPGSLRILLDPIELKLIASFVGALLVLCAAGGVAYDAAAEYSRLSQRLGHVKMVHGKLAAVGMDLADAAFAQRTFLLTGDPRDAQHWWTAVLQLTLDRDSLKETVHPGSAEHANLVALDLSIERSMQAMEQGMKLFREQGAAAARTFVLSGVGTVAMTSVRNAMSRMNDFARHEEDDREALLRRSREQTLILTLITLVAAAAALCAVFLAIRREMAARSSVERALRRRSTEAAAANRFLESLIRNIPHMIFVKEAKDLRFVRMNRAGEELLGVRESDIVGRTDRDLFPAKEADLFVAKDRQVLEKGEVEDIPNEEIQSASQGVRVLHTKKIPLLDGSGRPTHLLGISEDVTDARENERRIKSLNEAMSARAAEVERVNSARSVFLATMSHEIRTPMNGMLGMLELLSLSGLDDKQRQTLSVVSESGHSLLRIIDDILDFSKIEADKLELRAEVASIAAIVRDVWNIHSTVASSKGLVITTTVDPALSPAVWVDPVRLRQVLNNLVSNAVKFTSSGGVEIRVEVLTSHEEVQSIRLSVTDTGTGISPDEQVHLFQPFVQVGASGSRAPGGTGLGLVISRRLAELMGGSLAMSSTLGSGTTMSLVMDIRTAPAELLPLAEARKIEDLRAATALIRHAPGVAQAEAEGTLVLLADDHPVNRALLEQQLETLGYASETAPDGNEALRRWQSGRFGLVLTDCQMPGMDGYELARQIRKREAAAGARPTPIIACTAMALEGEAQKCL
ncbi:MAG: domain S-box protein, partial [Ramlibacter sp.]|nr:domain S-box protein [Ramlibacter sp.]